MDVRAFEVRTGKNKGFYFVENSNNDEGRDIFGSNGFCLGILQEENYEGFYQRHRAKGKRIWTFGSYTGHEYNREQFHKYITSLKGKGFSVRVLS